MSHSSRWTLRRLPGCVSGSSPCELLSLICATLPRSLVQFPALVRFFLVPWSPHTRWATAWSVVLPTLGISSSCFRSSARPSVKPPWSSLFQSLGCFMALSLRWSFVRLLLFIPSLCIVGTFFFFFSAECVVNIMERFLTLFWEKEKFCRASSYCVKNVNSPLVGICFLKLASNGKGKLKNSNLQFYI